MALINYRRGLIAIATLFASGLFAQDLDSLMNSIDGPAKKPEYLSATFKTTRLINLATIEQVKRGELDFRNTHRFDDAAGAAGGISTLYGFDNVTDIRIAFDYGINDIWTVGFARSKGAYVRRQILDFNSKLKVLRQKTSGMPISMSVYLATELSTMKSSTDIESVSYFGKNPMHRLNYVSQVLLARKFNERLSLELAPTLVHRNLVHYTEENTTFSLGMGMRYKFTKRMGIILDYYYNFNKDAVTDNFVAPLGVGIEIETGGHVFHLLFSNNKSLLESQYLTQNTDSWLKGQFRFGFNISRVFHIH
jgi:predicted porin